MAQKRDEQRTLAAHATPPSAVVKTIPGPLAWVVGRCMAPKQSVDTPHAAQKPQRRKTAADKRPRKKNSSKTGTVSTKATKTTTTPMVPAARACVIRELERSTGHTPTLTTAPSASTTPTTEDPIRCLTAGRSSARASITASAT